MITGIDELIGNCKQVLEGHYGPRLKGLVLYGSAARRQQTEHSDIDILVLLSKPFDYFLELRRIVDLLYSVQLESEQLISAKPAAADDFEHGDILLYRNAKKHGRPV
jgi:predicted nucleotidyltransferase